MTDYVKEYREATDRDEWGEGLERLIPERMRGGLVRYILHGVIPGHFLTAVLEGDLFEAMKRADDENQLLFRNYCMFLWNYAPSGCFGTAERVKDWNKDGGLLNG